MDIELILAGVNALLCISLIEVWRQIAQIKRRLAAIERTLTNERAADDGGI
jgi:hypothetical protein